MQVDSGYTKSRLQNPDSRMWDILSLTAILLCLFIFLAQWQQLPFFLDMYYHLAVARGFGAAGGVVGHNFWEYGPGGAAHLYPPLVHLLMLGFLKMGLDGITTLKLFSLLIPVLLLLTLWQVIKNILNKKTAFFVIFLSLCASLFMITASFTPAATLGMILLLFGIYSIYQNQTLPSILIFGMVFYTHLGIAVLSVVFIIMAKAFKIIETKKFLKIFFLSLLIGSPWLFHIIRNLPAISWQNTAQMLFIFYPVILLFFTAGLIIALKRIKEYKIFLVLFISLIPISLLYPFRFFCGQGMVGFLIFSGIGLEGIYSLIDTNLRKGKTTKKYTLFFLIVLLLYLIFFVPSISPNKNGINLKAADSLLTSIFEGKEKRPQYTLSSSMFSERFFGWLADYVERYSKKGEFLWSNYRYIAGILWAMTERPSLSSMLREIRPKKNNININDAALVIIIDEPKGEFEKIYNRIKGYFKIVGMKTEEGTDIYILKNKNSLLLPSCSISRPLLNMVPAFILLLAYLSFLSWLKIRKEAV